LEVPSPGPAKHGSQSGIVEGGVNGVNYRETFNDNMLVIVQIETSVGVANACDIALVLGVDVLLGLNGDMTNFSGLQPNHPEYPAFFPKTHDATLKAGEFLGPVTPTYDKPCPAGVGRPDFRQRLEALLAVNSPEM
jgi:2-keto-3-deoxy-L-rhamnonate aldolase RhmA